jgi:hypothetical protein
VALKPALAEVQDRSAERPWTGVALDSAYVELCGAGGVEASPGLGTAEEEEGPNHGLPQAAARAILGVSAPKKWHCAAPGPVV